MSASVKRLITIGGGAVVFCAAVLMILFGLSGNRLFFYDPSMVVLGDVDLDREFRLGGLVAPDSWTRQQDGLVNRFIITDCKANVRVEYRGILPDLFIEGQGAVARGTFDKGRNTLIANEVLARHDEAYTPREVEDALADTNQGQRGEYAELLANGCPILDQPQQNGDSA